MSNRFESSDSDLDQLSVTIGRIRSSLHEIRNEIYLSSDLINDTEENIELGLDSFSKNQRKIASLRRSQPCSILYTTTLCFVIVLVLFLLAYFNIL